MCAHTGRSAHSHASRPLSTCQLEGTLKLHAMLCRRYDGDNTGNIDDKEMMQALAELGVLDPKVCPCPLHCPPSTCKAE